MVVIHDDKGNPITEFPEVSGNRIMPVGDFDNCALRIDEATSSLYYIGWADIGSGTDEAAWAIMRVVVSSGYIGTWADGDAEKDNVWDNRASLSYS